MERYHATSVQSSRSRRVALGVVTASVGAFFLLTAGLMR
jgi:hypothetical protein